MTSLFSPCETNSICIMSEIGLYAKLGNCNALLTDSILKAARAYN